MIYLGEREIGFDAGGPPVVPQIGFPSIGGCRAIVLVTAGGLFGFHLSGTRSERKMNAFAQFVRGHAGGDAKRTLYIASRVGGNSEHTNAGECHAEIRDFARALGFNGPMYWADLSAVGGASAYVQFDSVENSTCVITARTWNDGVDGADGNKGNYVAQDRTMALGGAPARMFTNVDVVGLQAVYPTRVP